MISSQSICMIASQLSWQCWVLAQINDWPTAGDCSHTIQSQKFRLSTSVETVDTQILATEKWCRLTWKKLMAGVQCVKKFSSVSLRKPPRLAGAIHLKSSHGRVRHLIIGVSKTNAHVKQPEVGVRLSWDGWHNQSRGWASLRKVTLLIWRESTFSFL